MKKFYTRIFYFVVAAAMAVMSAPSAAAFSPDTYTDVSALASGRWVKVSVRQSGMHFIPASTLRSWGFSSPESVRVHGYGGRKISDVLSAENYIDDLPQVQTAATSAGVYFYAAGPVQWTQLSNGQWVHSINPFSDYGYYFLTDSGKDAREIPVTGTPGASNPAKSFTHTLVHENDSYTFSRTGNNLYGESLISQSNRTFNFSLRDLVEGQRVWTRIGIATDGAAASRVTFSANGTPLSPTGVINAKSSNFSWGRSANFDRFMNIEGNQLALGMNFTKGNGVQAANLDFIDVNYPRAIRLADGLLDFTTASRAVALEGVSADTRVWDVTDPLNIFRVEYQTEEASGTWTATLSGKRSYSAWNPDAAMPAPEYVGTVDNQNLHDPALTPDMVIFTLPQFMAQARRIADIHTYGADSLNVLVVNQQQVFEEFASGVPDAGAFRRMLKMFYDRGQQAGGKPLRYVLFFGRATFDNRTLTSDMKALNQPAMPTWQTDNALDDAYSYMTDHVYAFLDDNSGRNFATDRMRIAVGRIPVGTVNEATRYIDKLVSYLEKSPSGEWKNKVILMADNGDTGAHLTQAESLWEGMLNTEFGSRMVYNKVYLDAYDVVGGTCVGARNRLYRQLDEGTLLWNYIGHGSINALTGENMVRKTDIENNFYLRKLPMLMAATCSFMKWDGPEKSGAEELFLMPNGGVIAAICPSRTAKITNNGYFTDAYGRIVFKTDSLGRIPTMGEAFVDANNVLATRTNDRGVVVGDDNRLRFHLMGDPAVRLSVPSPTLRVETIDGEDIESADQIVIKARQSVEVTGVVVDYQGNVLNNFTGPLHMSLYDATNSVTSKGLPYDGTQGKAITFDDMGALLYQGRDSVVNGEFSFRMVMPSEIADNFRPAELSLFASSPGTRSEAIGRCTDFYVFGVDENAEADSIAPVIETAYMNHESFENGASVNNSPMFFATVSDNVGINLSLSGIGHQMTLRLDNRNVYSDVSLYYTPAPDGSASGTIAYPLDGLADGHHTLTLRVFDTSGNSATKTIDFVVREGMRPAIFDIYTDANPATTEANFYLRHDRPDATLTVTFEVFDMLGRKIWTSTNTDRSDMFQSAPVKWDLRNMGGQRVVRGIYIYRATVTTDDGQVKSHAKRIAVAGR